MKDVTALVITIDARLASLHFHDANLHLDRERPAMTFAQPKMPKLIVVMAFDRDEDGELVTAFGPQDYATEERAVRQAQTLAPQHAGVIAWSREANPDIGEYGEPVTLFQAGEIPDME